jgi:uncharacterized protein with FMN-binding domain
MSQTRTTHESKLQRALSKVFVSGFVVLSFVAYVVTQHTSDAGQPGSSPTRSAQPVISNPQVTPIRAKATQAAPTAVPTLQRLPTAFRPTALPPPPTADNSSAYRDGTFKGNAEDAYFGIVQVQATIQDGKITQVQFLNYPRDRRTSQQINSIAVPYLQEEAIQAQSANVDIISGATLTSDAFVRSLQSALENASNGS